jgi:L-ribulose-5-phosphate 3-epimerase
MTEIGVMQGRLLPRIDGRIQAFPWQDWRSEFPTAREVGLDSIEFIFEGPNIEDHPLMQSPGRESIKEAVRESSVRVGSICADYFMDEPLFRGTSGERQQRVDVLSQLVDGAAEIGANFVEIPCVDRSSLKSEAERGALVDAVSAVLPSAEEKGVGILLETDLPPAEFRSLLDRWGHPNVGANFDSGNSASLGYDPIEEIATLGETIMNVHIKDRLLGGTTVPLGTGAARFDDVFGSLGRIGYRGPLILQTARDDDDVGAVRRYLAMVRRWSEKYLERP